MQLTLSSLLTAALAMCISSPSDEMIEVTKYSGEVNPGSYIVRLRDGVDKAVLFKDANFRKAVTHDDWSAINGFAGVFDEATLDMLRSSGLVESIQEDGFMTIQAAVHKPCDSRAGAIIHEYGIASDEVTQTDAPWGLGRISHKRVVPGKITNLDYTYTYSKEYQGEGVDIYVIDTGVNLNHSDFGGRAVFGWTGADLARTDDHGHGSHVAGIAAGARYGVAKKAKIISVKALNQVGKGTVANIIGGFSYVLGAARASGRPSIVSASIGGPATIALDDAVKALTDAGIHVVVAAGNSNIDAGKTSPARVPSVITVGAVDNMDTKATFSNWGSVVDIWAPGVTIISTGHVGHSSTLALSGTSQATPHVSGLAAIYISQFGNVAPDVLEASLWSQKGEISNLPRGCINRLAVGPILI